VVQLKRFVGNPILAPIENSPWESRAVFNPGALLKDNIIHILYRGIARNDKYYISQLGHAYSDDGFHFTRTQKQPVLEPKEAYDKWSIEDPRIMTIDKEIYVTYVAINVPVPTPKKLSYTALASTKDFLNFQRLGVITAREDIDDRDTVLFPEKFGNDYIMLHRPQQITLNGKYQEFESGLPSRIWLTRSSSLTQWNMGSPLLKPEYLWESSKIGIGPPPLKTEKGWLLIYHGVDKNYVYRIGLALLDLQDPTIVIRRLPYPVLEPKENYETTGDFPNVVFPCGAVIREGKLFVYYGGADKVCAVATAGLEEVLDSLLTSG